MNRPVLYNATVIGLLSWDKNIIMKVYFMACWIRGTRFFKEEKKMCIKKKYKRKRVGDIWKAL